MLLRILPVGVLLLAFISTGLAAESVPDLVIADFESLDGWRGLELDRSEVKEGEASGLWHRMTERTGVTTSSFPHDWSRHTAVSFWMHNARKVDARFMLNLRSENPASEGPDYYSLKLRLDRWTGWKQLIVPLGEFSAARRYSGRVGHPQYHPLSESNPAWFLPFLMFPRSFHRETPCELSPH